MQHSISHLLMKGLARFLVREVGTQASARNPHEIGGEWRLAKGQMEKRKVLREMDEKMHHRDDGETPDCAETPANTGATVRKNPTDQGWV